MFADIEIDNKPLSDLSVPQVHSPDVPSPFARPATSSRSSDETAQNRGPPSLEPRRSTLSVAPSGIDEPRSLSPSKPSKVRASMARTRTQSARRVVQEPGSPGSDQDPDPPKTRQDARPIFGGIAKMFRGQAGKLILYHCYEYRYHMIILHYFYHLLHVHRCWNNALWALLESKVKLVAHLICLTIVSTMQVRLKWLMAERLWEIRKWQREDFLAVTNEDKFHLWNHFILFKARHRKVAFCICFKLRLQATTYLSSEDTWTAMNLDYLLISSVSFISGAWTAKVRLLRFNMNSFRFFIYFSFTYVSSNLCLITFSMIIWTYVLFLCFWVSCVIQMEKEEIRILVEVAQARVLFQERLFSSLENHQVQCLHQLLQQGESLQIHSLTLLPIHQCHRVWWVLQIWTLETFINMLDIIGSGESFKYRSLKLLPLISSVEYFEVLKVLMSNNNDSTICSLITKMN